MVRRKEAQAHVEMLRAARDELLLAFGEVQQLTAQAMEPLDEALERAKGAADKAVQKLRAEQAAELKAGQAAELEAEPVAEPESAPEPARPLVPESGLEPDLSNIFERLRQEEPSASELEPDDSAATISQAAQAAVEPDAASEADLKLGVKLLSEPSQSLEAPEPPVELEPLPATPEPSTTAGATAGTAADTAAATSSDTVSDTANDELLRQLKRALTQDESRVLRAVHKFNGKPSKLKALKRTILEDSPRQAFLAEYLREADVASEVLEQTMTIPLTQELNACDWQHTDLKFLVQQVRDIYRQFASEKLTAAAADLASAGPTGSQTESAA